MSLAIAACGGSVDVEGSGGAGGAGGAGTGAGGSGGSVPAGDCATDADCSGSPCVPITAGGYKVCLKPPPEATTCKPPGSPVPDACCSSADCMVGQCFAFTDVPYCGGPAPADYNACIADECASDADCGQFGPAICAPAGAFGLPMRRCFAAHCATDADCTAKPGGHCAPVRSICCSVPMALACVYPGGCQQDDDCTPAGTKHCEIDPATKQSVCVDGPAACPA